MEAHLELESREFFRGASRRKKPLSYQLFALTFVRPYSGNLSAMNEREIQSDIATGLQNVHCTFTIFPPKSSNTKRDVGSW